MIYKSYILEQSLQTINNLKMFLFYGENHGLKKEFKVNIKDLNKDREILNLFQEEVIKNKNILINEISNKSLFNEKKIIFINEVNEKIIDSLDEIAKNIQDDKIFLFADILDKKSKLRNYFEKSKIAGVAACYQDNEITFRKIIMKKMSGYKGLSTETINFIIQNTGLDRSKLNNEIDKIISCFNDKKIELQKLDSLLNTKTNEDFNMLKDAALNGNKITTNRLLSDTILEQENNIYYLNLINQRINKLNEIESLKNKNSNIESLISSLKPPVFWKDKPNLIQQSKKWNKSKIRSALKKTYYTELRTESYF